jgi:hypothetical protein
MHQHVKPLISKKMAERDALEARSWSSGKKEKKESTATATATVDNNDESQSGFKRVVSKKAPRATIISSSTSQGSDSKTALTTLTGGSWKCSQCNILNASVSSRCDSCDQKRTDFTNVNASTNTTSSTSTRKSPRLTAASSTPTNPSTVSSSSSSSGGGGGLKGGDHYCSWNRPAIITPTSDSLSSLLSTTSGPTSPTIPTTTVGGKEGGGDSIVMVGNPTTGTGAQFGDAFMVSTNRGEYIWEIVIPSSLARWARRIASRLPSLDSRILVELSAKQAKEAIQLDAQERHALGLENDAIIPSSLSMVARLSAPNHEITEFTVPLH